MNDICNLIILYFITLSYSIFVAAEVRREYCVVLTSIPPRFDQIHVTVESWLRQTFPPKKILIVIPTRYRRFRRKSGERAWKTNIEELETALRSANYNKQLADGVLEIYETATDFGPLTKFIGSLQYQIEHTHMKSGFWVDYWMYCDDDMKYRPQLAQYYMQQIDNYANKNSKNDQLEMDNVLLSASESELMYNEIGIAKPYHSMAYTLFSSEQRLHFQLAHEHSPRHITHIQGVDTYMIPTEALGILDLPTEKVMTQRTGEDSINIRPLSDVLNVERLVQQYHSTVCPESYYQDDYVVSFLLNLAGINVTSIQNPCKVLGLNPHDDLCKKGVNMVESIEGLTKSHFQMHLNEDVFRREHVTQHCLMNTADVAYRILHKV